MTEGTFHEKSAGRKCPRAVDLHHKLGGRGRGAERRRLPADYSFERFDDRIVRGNLSAAAITALFFGQRIAKDYAGAAVLAQP